MGENEIRKKNAPKVSVIIPSYNRAKFIRETIDSVLNQTYKNIVLFVVDDGSTDETLEVLKVYGSRVTILQHHGGVNKGQSAAINLGMETSESKYVAILDSDDLFYPSKIEKQVEYLEKNPSIGVVYSNGMNINEQGEPLYTLYPSGNRPVIGPEPVLEFCAYNLPSNAMVRRTVFDMAGSLSVSLRSAQDHDMAIRLAEVAPVGYIDEILWAYRRHDASISHTRTIERWRNGFTILAVAAKRYPYPLKLRFRRKAILHFRLGQCYATKKSYIFALGHLLCAAFYNPVRSLRVLLGAEETNSASS